MLGVPVAIGKRPLLIGVYELPHQGTIWRVRGLDFGLELALSIGLPWMLVCVVRIWFRKTRDCNDRGLCPDHCRLRLREGYALFRY